MSYEKQTWVNSEVITAEKLNHMEDGIAEDGGGVFAVKMTPSGSLPNLTLTPDKSFEDAIEAYNSGKVVVAIIENAISSSVALSFSAILVYNDYMGDKLEGQTIIASGDPTEEGLAQAITIRWNASSVSYVIYNI